ncbi:MAG: GlsB/YeaQ/YmgE family stress response membrane protein [Bacteroidales bacterium]|nr:GlsB/YeaQ/YmgE family stress response membrane protein [Bacteroidales bacterium]
MNFIWFILIGLLAGFLAGLFMRGKGFGFWINLLVGIIGAILGGMIFDWLGIVTKNFVGNLISAFVGAVVLLFILSLIKRR